ncbi:MAG: hypothetical protein LUG64_07975 [Clostridiales bacterium]|nr:hypothetical protein [Clostridiales bacterium]
MQIANCKKGDTHERIQSRILEKPLSNKNAAEQLTTLLNQYAQEGWKVCAVQSDESLLVNMIVLEREK